MRRCVTSRLRAGASRRRRPPGRHHRRQPLPRQSRLARRLHPAAGARPRRVLRRHRWPGLCPPRHQHRHPPDRHRPRAGRRSDGVPGFAGHGARRGHAARLGDAAGPAAARREAAPAAGPSSARRTAARMAATDPLPSRRLATPVRCAGSDLRPSNSPTRPCDWAPARGGRITEALYEGYALQSIRIPGAAPHPTRLVQSAAMASVAPPKPSYRPHLPAGRHRRRPAVRRPARKRDLCRRSPCRLSRRIMDRR